MSGRATMTSRTVMLSSSMALWIISSWNSGIWPNWRLAVTMSLSSSGEWTAPPRRVGLRAKEAQDQAAGAAHKEQDGAGEGEERLHGRGDGEGDLLGALQGQSLRDEFAEDHVHVGDQAEGDGDGDGVGVDGGVRHFVDELACLPPGGRPWARRSSRG